MPVEQLSFGSAGASSRAHAQESEKGFSCRGRGLRLEIRKFPAWAGLLSSLESFLLNQPTTAYVNGTTNQCFSFSPFLSLSKNQ